MSSVERPNTAALREALDIYRDAMRRFVVKVFEDSGRSAGDAIAAAFGDRRRERFRREVRSRGPAGAINIGDFQPIIRKHRELFERHFNLDPDFWDCMRLIAAKNSHVTEPPNEGDINDQDALVLRANITSILRRVDRDAMAQVDAIWASDTAGRWRWLNWERVQRAEVVSALPLTIIGYLVLTASVVVSVGPHVRRSIGVLNVDWYQAAIVIIVLAAIVVVIRSAVLSNKRQENIEHSYDDTHAGRESGELLLDLGALPRRHVIVVASLAVIIFLAGQGFARFDGSSGSPDGSSTAPATSTAGTSVAATGTVAPARFAVPAGGVSAVPGPDSTFTAPQLWVVANTGVIGVAWRDDCEDSAKVTKRDESGEEGAATRAGTVWGAGTAVLEVPEEGGPDCADAPKWHYVVSADPDWVVNEDGDTPKSWVHEEYLEPSLGVEEYVRAVESASCEVDGVSLALLNDREPQNDDGPALLEVSCQAVVGGWQVRTLVEAIEDYEGCGFVSISLPDRGAEYVLGEGETANDALLTSEVKAREPLVLRCDTGQRRFVAVPGWRVRPPAASTTRSTATATATSATATATATATPRTIRGLPESPEWRFFIDTVSDEGTGPRDSVPASCTVEKLSGDLEEGEEVYFESPHERCANWAYFFTRDGPTFLLPDVELLECGRLDDIDLHTATLDRLRDAGVCIAVRDKE